jgi:Arc/MetJ family transcription regulator
VTSTPARRLREPPAKSSASVYYLVAMRLHISLEDDLVAQLDRRVGRRRRSSFIAATLRRALEDERRWEEIEAALAGVADQGHEWDADPATWVRAQRRGDPTRVG